MQLEQHFEDECTEYEMNCPFDKDKCPFKVGKNSAADNTTIFLDTCFFGKGNF